MNTSPITELTPYELWKATFLAIHSSDDTIKENAEKIFAILERDENIQITEHTSDMKEMSIANEANAHGQTQWLLREFLVLVYTIFLQENTWFWSASDLQEFYDEIKRTYFEFQNDTDEIDYLLNDFLPKSISSLEALHDRDNTLSPEEFTIVQDLKAFINDKEREQKQKREDNSSSNDDIFLA